MPYVEIQLILEFIRHYHLYTSESPPRPGDTLDWLAVMRHHGAPTRLVDFTFSFLVASYFALADEPRSNLVVWAVNKSGLTDRATDWAKASAITSRDFEEFATYRDGEAFRRLFLKGNPNLVFPASPFRRNQRLAIQSGIFLCPGNVQIPLKDLLKEDDNWLKIRIAACRRDELLRSLARSGWRKPRYAFSGARWIRAVTTAESAAVRQIKRTRDQ
jgi:hypothetical protein